MKTLAWFVTLCSIAAGALAIGKQSPANSMLLAPFSLGPLFITLVMSLLCGKTSSQALLLTATCLYSVWFTLVYTDAFHWHFDHQRAFASILFCGIQSLPVMLPIWIVAFSKRRIQPELTSWILL